MKYAITDPHRVLPWSRLLTDDKSIEVHIDYATNGYFTSVFRLPDAFAALSDRFDYLLHQGHAQREAAIAMGRSLPVIIIEGPGDYKKLPGFKSPEWMHMSPTKFREDVEELMRTSLDVHGYLKPCRLPIRGYPTLHRPIV